MKRFLLFICNLLYNFPCIGKHPIEIRNSREHTDQIDAMHKDKQFDSAFITYCIQASRAGSYKKNDMECGERKGKRKEKKRKSEQGKSDYKAGLQPVPRCATTSYKKKLTWKKKGCTKLAFLEHF